MCLGKFHVNLDGEGGVGLEVGDGSGNNLSRASDVLTGLGFGCEGHHLGPELGIKSLPFNVVSAFKALLWRLLLMYKHSNKSEITSVIST